MVLYGSVRRERQGIKFARFLETQLEKRGHTSKLIDPVEYDLPLLDKMYKEYSKGAAPERLEAIAGLIRQADGFLVVSGEYNHSIPPALTNMLDHFLEEWFWRPSAIACYSAGDFGGVRARLCNCARPWPNLACLASPRSSLCRGFKTNSTRTAHRAIRYTSEG